ncbi:MAG: hypothetical protein M0Q95_20340, partial [Porticoccaceae bacterium]|nr:hypothetical protein [Porticoccaceae bacterium]
MDKSYIIELAVAGKAFVGGAAGEGDRRDGEVALLVGIEGAPVAEDALQLRQAHGSSLAPGVEAEGFHFC